MENYHMPLLVNVNGLTGKNSNSYVWLKIQTLGQYPVSKDCKEKETNYMN